MFIKIAMQHPIPRKLGYRHFVERMVEDRWPGMRVVWGDPSGQVYAEIIRSSWAITCPFCAGAILAQPGEPFFCPDCMMQANGYAPMRVVWPEKRQEIEAMLLKRPNPGNRNWHPGETVALLAAENLEHGIQGQF